MIFEIGILLRYIVGFAHAVVGSARPLIYSRSLCQAKTRATQIRWYTFYLQHKQKQKIYAID
jgi:hypothetical protein